MTRSTQINPNSLLQTASDDGILSPNSMQALQVVDVGSQIQNALGTPADDVQASEVVLVTMLVDDSGSIRFAKNTKTVRQGHNHVIDALVATKQRDSLLVHTRYLNGFVLYPYMPIDQAVKMDAQNYNPVQGTPLYDEAVVTLATVVAKAQEFADNGVPVRTITLIITDGDDQHSVRANANKVRTIVGDMLRQENHIIAAMGIDDGSTDFRLIFKGMGLRDEWILTPGNKAADIRRAFELFSQSAVRASQGIGSFSQTALGGFTGP